MTTHPPRLKENKYQVNADDNVDVRPKRRGGVVCVQKLLSTVVR